MAVLVKESGAYRIGTKIAITGTAPAAWSWAIIEDGKILPGYGPVVLFVFDCVADDGGLVRTGFTVREKGPHFTYEGGTLKLFPNLSALVAYHQLEGASVTMTRLFFNSASGTEEIVEVAGTIVQVEDVSAASTSFAVELRSEVAHRTMPRVTVKRGANEGLTDSGIPNDAIGSAVPVPLGLFARYLGQHFGAESAQEWRFRDAMFFRPNVIPAIEVYRTATVSRFAYADYLRSDGLRIADPSDITNIGNHAGFVYLREDDAYAYIMENGNNILWDSYSSPWNTGLYTFAIYVKPWLLAPFRPPKMLTTVGTVVAPESCIDGEPFTYTEIDSGGSVYLEVPQPKYRGRISQNSNDAGTGTYGGGDDPEAPCGISVYVCLVAPVGVTVPSGGSVNVEVVFPDTDQKVFGHTTKNIAQPTTAGTATRDNLYLPYRNQSTGAIGGASDGWAGTKWHQYDFTSAPVAGDQDNPLYDAGSANKTKPFRIKLSVGGSGKKCFVAAVAWCVGAKHNVEAYTPEVTLKPTGRARKSFGSSRRRYERVIEWYGDDPEPPTSRRFVSGRHAWDRGAGEGTEKEARERPSLQNIYASAASYADTDGSYTGTVGAVLSNTADQVRFLLQGYGKESSFVTVLGQFGSFANARNILDKWAQLWGVGFKWKGDFLSLLERKVNEGVLDLTSQAPGLFACKTRIGAWCAHVWYPDPATTLIHDYYGEINPIHCLKAGAGVQVSIDFGDEAQIVNDITVNYGWDPGRGRFLYTATCNATDYSDGQGGYWPLVFGSDAAALCEWSQGTTANRRFGIKKASFDLHGVRDGRLATVFGASILARRYRKTPTLRLTTDAAYCDMQFGHLFTLNHNAMLALGHAAPAWAGVANWGSVWWRCTHAEEQGVDGAIVSVIEAEWMPTTIGGETSGFAPEEGEGVL